MVMKATTVPLIETACRTSARYFTTIVAEVQVLALEAVLGLLDIVDQVLPSVALAERRVDCTLVGVRVELLVVDVSEVMKRRSCKTYDYGCICITSGACDLSRRAHAGPSMALSVDSKLLVTTGFAK